MNTPDRYAAVLAHERDSRQLNKRMRGGWRHPFLNGGQSANTAAFGHFEEFSRLQ